MLNFLFFMIEIEYFFIKIDFMNYKLTFKFFCDFMIFYDSIKMADLISVDVLLNSCIV